MKAEIGNKIEYGPFTVEIAKILSQYEYGDDIDIEFEDPKGEYHHWKSWDGGELVKE